MLHLDIAGALAATITPTHGIKNEDLTQLRTAMKRYTEDWLKERKNGLHPWSMDPYKKDVIKDVKTVAKRAASDGITTIVWVGIGGSGLGPKVIQEVLEGPETREFILLDTIDPSILEMTMDIIDWRSTLLVVASKSGGTLEPMSTFLLCYEKLREAMKGKAPERVVAITDPAQGHLRRFSTEHGFRMLPIPPDVGGRYSVFTPIGLLAIALLDGDIDAFVRGAKEVDTACQQSSLDDNPAALLASVQYLIDTKRGCPIRVIMPYSQRLESVARWNQQLIAESLGKEEGHNPIPLAAIGTQDQHSLLQQWMAGPRSSMHVFIRELAHPEIRVPEETPKSLNYVAGKPFGELLDACYLGTSRALTEVKRPHVTISIDTLDESHLGQLFFLLLAEVIYLGKLYRIDPYGQPAVEIGKNITREILGYEG